MSWTEGELRALKRMLWLQEQILARQQPITEEQLERFGKNPDVIIPDLAVELRRLPKTYGPIHSSMLSKEGELAFLTTHEGWLVAVVGDRMTRLRQISNPLWPDVGAEYLVDVVDGRPRWIDTHGFLAGDDLGSDPWDLQARWVLKLGNDTLFETKGVEAVLPLRDGSILFCARRAEKNMYQISRWRDGNTEILVERETRPIRRFRETSDGTVWCFWSEDRNRPMCGRLTESNKTPFFNMVDVVETGEGVCFIRQFGSHNPELGRFEECHDPAIRQDFVWSQKKRIGEVEYESNYTVLPDGRSAYIGWARHLQERWVVDGSPQPAMNWVSQPFEHREHGLCYLGLTGHQVLTIQFPG